ncbi:hypothetical protein PHET_09452 [Paragonimus heterotremus]|uniref:Peptidase A2 domain-containing protein n=1 Tax=Paragonimus heterotremus TaxID=100268 RepID=A0A8J4WEW6_9TREM|nr:hypothetical protein PHET_09452 [Paragonimus heterotremus]
MRTNNRAVSESKASSAALLLIPSAETPVSHPQVALVIVPVVLRHVKRSIHICAFLDSGSDATSIRESLVKRLGLTGQPKRLTLSALNQRSSLISTEVKVDMEFVVSKAVVHLTRDWSVKRLPEVGQVVPTNDELQSWGHLRDVWFSNCSTSKTGILIGSDVPEAYWVIEQRAGKWNAPYAVRKILGWTLMGPIIHRKSSAFDVPTLQLQNIHSDIERLYNMEFVDSTPGRKRDMCTEDREALTKLESSIILKDGH